MSNEIIKEDKENIDNIKVETTALIDENRAIAVIDDPTCKSAGEYIAQLQIFKKGIVAYFKPSKDQAFQLHKKLVAMEKDETAPIDNEISRGKLLIGDYLAEKRRIEVQKQREEAEKLRQKEEAARIEASLLKNKEDALLKSKEADIIAREEIAPVVNPKVKMDSGSMNTTVNYKFAVHDKIRLLQALIDGDIPMEAVNFSLDVRVLKKYVKENNLDKIAGLTIVKHESVTVRA